MAKAAAVPLLLAGTAAATGAYSAYEARESRKDQQAFNKKQEAKAAAELEKVQAAEQAAIDDAKLKEEDRRKRVAAGGRESTFATGNRGVTGIASTKRKTLLGE